MMLNSWRFRFALPPYLDYHEVSRRHDVVTLFSFSRHCRQHTRQHLPLIRRITHHYHYHHSHHLHTHITDIVLLAAFLLPLLRVAIMLSLRYILLRMSFSPLLLATPWLTGKERQHT